MAGKGGKKKKGAKSKGSKKAGGNGNGGGKASKERKGRKKRKSGSGKMRCGADIFSAGAMENAYYTCHNVQDVLYNRGFPWPDAHKKKKKK